MEKTYDLSKCVIGPIVGFAERPDSRTGYQITMLVRGMEHTFDVTKEAYSVKYSDEFRQYPQIGEIQFIAAGFDSDGILTELGFAFRLGREENHIKTKCVIGTYRMFEAKITDETPVMRDFLTLEGNTVTLTDFDKYQQAGLIKLTRCGGSIPVLKDGVSFRLAPDTVVYTWDWTKAKRPFARCSAGEAIARAFPTRFYPGAREDIMKNCYFIGFHSTRGDEDVIDMIECYLNGPPGWE